MSSPKPTPAAAASSSLAQPERDDATPSTFGRPPTPLRTPEVVPGQADPGSSVTETLPPSPGNGSPLREAPGTRRSGRHGTVSTDLAAAMNEFRRCIEAGVFVLSDCEPGGSSRTTAS